MSSANTPSTCDVAVVDTTSDKLFDTDRLTSVVNDMRNRTGLDIYVRTFQTSPHDDLGVWWRGEYKECPAWLSTDGVTPKPNILVLAVGMDRKSAIEYGSAVHKLDGEVDSIRGRVLGDALRDANAAPQDQKHEAFTSAIEKTLAELEAEYTKPPFNWGALWSGVLKTILSILGVASATFGVILTRTGLRKRRDKARLRKELKAAFDASTDAVVHAEDRLSQSFIEADDAMNGVEGEFIALPSKESITERINAASSEHFERAGNPAPKSIEDLTAARNAYRRYADSIESALSDAQNRTESIKARARQCTPEVKDSDLREAYTAGARRLRTLVDESPSWLSTTTTAAVLSVAIKSVDGLVGTSAPRAAVDTAINEVTRAVAEADSLVANATAAEKSLLKVISDADATANTYTSRVPDDVSPKTAESTLRAVKKVVADANKVYDTLKLRDTSTVTSGLVSQTADLRKKLERATAAADTEIAKAKRKRDEERRAREAEEARKRREREEEEARQRATSFGVGYGSGYSSGGGFSSGGFSGGGDFGGGSSGSW